MVKQTSVKAPMTKDLMMKYTFIALCVLAAISFIALGFVPIILSAISVLVAVACDYLLSLVMRKKGQLNTWSAAVFGLIVALSYTLATPSAPLMSSYAGMPELLPMDAPMAYVYVAIIAALGMVVFKKLQGLLGRKYLNPAATAKLVVFLPFLKTVLEPSAHEMTSLAGPVFFNGTSMAPSFASLVQSCLANVGIASSVSPADFFETMILLKYHTWIGGVSSIAVIAVGIGLFLICRGYIKWRITLAYLVTTIVMALIMSGIYGGDALLRVGFTLFIGSSIFLAFFMATDPATTPVTHVGQNVFGIGLGVLTVLIQTYMNFLGGSILALVIMNLTTPMLDKVGVPKPGKKRPERRRPEAKQFTATKTYDCVRCGACMYACQNSLSPILIKQAFEKRNAKTLMTLAADYCTGCRTCNFVCPAGINLESYTIGYPLQEEEAKKIEEQFLSGTADENIGVYSEMFSAKSDIDGQDGGVTTALLVSGMENGLFDAAIVVKRTDGYWAEAVIAENADEIIEAKGTKYLRIPLMSKLGELIAKGKRKIAIVGMACEVRAARRIQPILLSEYPDLELTIIGLFCYECFDYYKLKEETTRLLDVDLDSAEKTQIHKGKYIVTIDGKEHATKVKELNNAVEGRCLDCPDFTAQYSDISVGSVGSDEGYSTVIVRSDIGKKLVESLDLAKGKADKEAVTKLSILKEKRAKLNRSGD